MKQDYTAAELTAQVKALRLTFDDVTVIEPRSAQLLDPASWQPAGNADELPMLDQNGRAWRYQTDGTGTLVLYQAVCMEGRGLVLALRTAIQPPPDDAREANAFARALSHCRDDLRHDFVTGAYNRRYLDEMYMPYAVRAAADGKPVRLVMVRVNEYAALCSREGAEAADCCLNTAAGILQLAVGPAAESAVLARLEDGVFAAVAVGDASAALEITIRSALQEARREFSISLSRRGSFTAAVASAAWAETGAWDLMFALAGQRLAHS